MQNRKLDEIDESVTLPRVLNPWEGSLLEEQVCINEYIVS